MASGSRASTFESRSESSAPFDPLLASWMSRDVVHRYVSEVSDDEESKKKDKDSESVARHRPANGQTEGARQDEAGPAPSVPPTDPSDVSLTPKTRSRLACCLQCLRVFADYMFGCETDEDVRPVVSGAAPALARTPTPGSSIEEPEYVAPPVDNSQWLPTNREIRELFRIFDKNHDNTISVNELGKMLRCMGMEVSEADVGTIMKKLDKNGNGKIEYREFKAFMQEEMKRSEENPLDQEKSIRMAFQVFDQNCDGVIDAKELKAAMKNLGEPLSDKELSDMMRDADLDKDGKINYEEFIKIWLESSKN